MAGVLAANAQFAGAGRVTSSHVQDLLEVGNTLVVLDGDGRVTAWQLPGLLRLGTLIEEGARGIGWTRAGQFGVLNGSMLSFYVASDGYLPRKFREIDTMFDDNAAVFGPYSLPGGAGHLDSAFRREGVLLIGEAFRGVYYDLTLERPFHFDLSNDPVLESASGDQGVKVAAVTAGETGVYAGLIDGEGLASLLVATTSGQVVRLNVHTSSSDQAGIEAALDSVMSLGQSDFDIRTLAAGPYGVVLFGTDHGFHWGLHGLQKRADTISWEGGVEWLSFSESGAVVASANRVGLIERYESEDAQILEIAIETRIDGARITALSDDGGVIGREDGTVVFLDPTGRRFSADAKWFGADVMSGSNLTDYAPSGQVVSVLGESPERSLRIGVEIIPSTRIDISNVTGAADFGDEALPEPSFRLRESEEFFVNDVEASHDWILASGMRSDYQGVWWAWPAGEGDAVEIEFGPGRDAAFALLDIVQDVEIVDHGRQVAALNGTAGELGFWAIDTWEKVGSVVLQGASDANGSNDMLLAASDDGVIVVVEDGESHVRAIDTETHEVVWSFALPFGDLTDLAVSPDGDRVVMVNDGSELLLVDARSPLSSPQVIRRQHLAGEVVDLTYSPDGDSLALAFSTEPHVQTINAHSLRPIGPAWSDAARGRVTSVHWSPDGEHLAIGIVETKRNAVTGDTHTRFLDVEMLTWRPHLCELARTQFTASEWDDIVATDLPAPKSCAWSEAGDSSGRTDSDTAPSAAAGGGLTMDDLMAGAPVPSMCEHPAGTLVLGTLPNALPWAGGVELHEVAFGDLTGDGVGDALAIIACNAGGVPWPPIFAAYTRGRDGSAELIGTISATDLAGEGSGSRNAESVAIINGEGRVEISATMEGDADCCGSLPVEATLAVADGNLVIADVVRHYDIGAMAQLFKYHSDGYGPTYPAEVTAAVDDFRSRYFHYSPEVGQCANRKELNGELASRVETLPVDAGPVRYCTIIASGEDDEEPLLVRLVPGDRGRWQVESLVPPLSK
ncbi:WD40 repeat domain-containing protein [Myceligenerans halotolerans]